MKPKKKEHWDLIIEPNRSLLNIKLKQLFRYRDLLIQMVLRDITVVYKQTVLGPIWFFVQPILTTVIYVFVFGRIANISTDGIPGPLFYMGGIVVWNYFADCFNKTSDTFVQNAGVFGKVYFPRLISPLSVVISNSIKFVIQIVLFLVIYVYYFATTGNLQPQISLLGLPLFIILMAALGLGLGLIFSSLTTKYKDLKFLIQFGVQLLMYATPIIYPLSTIPEKLQFYFKLNPITHIVEGFKYAFFGIGYFNPVWLLYSIGVIFLVLILGIIVFNKTEKDFMDTV